jgi:Ran GTPase-activating protein (RanGAP) involved in mRNA processing and transport
MASNFTELVENVITCPVCFKHFDQPRMLPCKHTFCFQCIQNMDTGNDGMLRCPNRDGAEVEKDKIGDLPANEVVRELVQLINHPNLNPPKCYRCEAEESAFWCDSDCKHCYCSKCWDIIHELGQSRHHTKVPVKDRPFDMPRCKEHDEDDKVKYRCEQCNKDICNNCHEFKHKGHPVILMIGDVKPLQDEYENGLQGVQLCLTYRSKRAEKVTKEIEEESQLNQSKVKEAMASLREIIDKHEDDLLKNIMDDEKAQKKSIEEYKCQLQGEQQVLIKEIFDFVTISHSKQATKLLDAKKPFEEYMKRADSKLLELKPKTRYKNDITGLDKLNAMKDQIKNIKMEQVPKYPNKNLQQRIDSNPDKSTLNLSSSELTDQDMEIVAAELEINKTLKTLQLYANKISDLGAQHLADALREHKTLTDLQLYNNQIGVDGLEHFADALRTNKTLNTLSLYKNKIGDEEAQYIADGLKTNKEMEAQIRNINVEPVPIYENPALQQRITANGNGAQLNLYNSNLTDQDMEIVARHLKTNTTLTVLYLYQNQIGDQGAQHLGDALKTNQTLTILQLHQNQIGDQGAQHLSDALKINQVSYFPD